MFCVTVYEKHEGTDDRQTHAIGLMGGEWREERHRIVRVPGGLSLMRSDSDSVRDSQYSVATKHIQSAVYALTNGSCSIHWSVQ